MILRLKLLLLMLSVVAVASNPALAQQSSQDVRLAITGGRVTFVGGANSDVVLPLGPLSGTTCATQIAEGNETFHITLRITEDSFSPAGQPEATVPRFLDCGSGQCPNGASAVGGSATEVRRQEDGVLRAVVIGGNLPVGCVSNGSTSFLRFTEMCGVDPVNGEFTGTNCEGAMELAGFGVFGEQVQTRRTAAGAPVVDFRQPGDEARRGGLRIQLPLKARQILGGTDPYGEISFDAHQATSGPVVGTYTFSPVPPGATSPIDLNAAGDTNLADSTLRLNGVDTSGPTGAPGPSFNFWHDSVFMLELELDANALAPALAALRALHDTDMDGIDNSVDADDDGDGILDDAGAAAPQGPAIADAVCNSATNSELDECLGANHERDYSATCESSATDAVVTDYRDGDTDGDGLCDGNGAVASDGCLLGEDRDVDGCFEETSEAVAETNPADNDTDSDGLCDGNDRGAQAGCSFGEDLDRDGLEATETDPRNADTDADGLCDGPNLGAQANPAGFGLAWSCAFGEDLAPPDGVYLPAQTDPRLPDSDADGLCDGDRAAAGCLFAEDRDRNGAYLPNDTDPRQPDTDMDGLCDGGGTLGCPAGEDADRDGVYLPEDPDPRAVDSDMDGFCDGPANGVAGCSYGEDLDGDRLYLDDTPAQTDPRRADTDGDGLADALEDQPPFGAYLPADTDPRNADSDVDGLCDGGNLGAQTQPVGSTELWSCSFGEDLNANGLPATAETNPRLHDTDMDGLCDGGGTGFCALGEDNDRDGVYVPEDPDPRAVDTDMDGLCDGPANGVAGCAYGEDLNGDRVYLPDNTDPRELDTDMDGLCDGGGTTACALGEDNDLDGTYLPEDPDPRAVDTDMDGFCDGPANGVAGCAFGEDLDADRVYLPEHTDPRLTDSDGDGISDFAEDRVTHGEYLPGDTDPRTPDTDGDGLCDGATAVGATCALGEDPDGDQVYLDDAGAPSSDPRLADSDNDGLCDGDRAVGSCARGEDLDRDGLYLTDTDSPHEGVAGADTDPRSGDTDGDGLCDGLSVGSDPIFNPAGAVITWVCNLGEDVDTDLLYLTDVPGNTDPRATDSDMDGLADGAEVNTHQTDPLDGDSDDDGLTDGDEVNTYETNPNDADSDDDSVSDGDEVNGHPPTDPLSGDSDDDSVSDATDNCPAIANLGQENADGDARGDLCDNCVYESNADQTDTDMNGIGNVCECGDVSGANGSPDGVVDDFDLDAVTDHVDGTTLLTGLAREKCSVVGVAGPCDQADLDALTDALDPPTGGLLQVCRPAVCVAVVGDNFDEDCAADVADTCPTIPDVRLDPDMDGVDQACDICQLQANPPPAVPGADRTLVSRQRDDDGDGRGNRCDFDYDGLGALVTATDFNEMKASVGSLAGDEDCGVSSTLGCAQFDHDEAGAVVTGTDFNLMKAAVGKLISSTFPTCLTCARPYSCALDDPDAEETFGRPVCVGPACAAPGQPDPCQPPE